MSDKPVATTIEAVGVYLWHMSEKQDLLGKQIEQLAETQKLMATHHDIRRLEESISGLATKVEVEEKVEAIRAELRKSSPSSQFDRFVKFMAQVAVVATGLGVVGAVLYGGVHVVDEWRDVRASRVTKP